MADLGTRFQVVNDTREDSLRSALELVRAGGVLYLPPGVWTIERPGLVVPPAVELWFSPGARLVPRSAYIEIQGSIRAGLHAIFVPSAFRVRMTGAGVPEVFPEWWGAGEVARSRADHGMREDDVGDDTDAVQAAFDACVDRLRGTTPRAPCAIVLSGSYRISRPLVLGTRDLAADFPACWVVLRGQNPGGRRATFRWVAPSPQGPRSFVDTMLLLRGMPGTTLSDVSFDGGDLVGSCVAVTAPPFQTGPTSQPGGPPPSSALWSQPCGMVSFRHCSFSGARSRLVQLGGATGVLLELLLPRTLDERGAGTSALGLALLRAFVAIIELQGMAQDVSATAFEGCQFRPSRPGSVAVELIALRSSPVSFSRCTFEGIARRMILARGGFLGLTACRFYCRPGTSQTPLVEPEETVTDLELLPGAPGTEGTERSRASCSVLDATSLSPRFLLARSADLLVLPGDVTLVNVRHTPVAPSTSTVESVHFDTASGVPLAGDVGDALTLVGCVLHRVRVGPGVGLVVSGGSQFLDAGVYLEDPRRTVLRSIPT
ncbi:MAG: hypothetical protein HY909_19445 [Deltaproteobacteria bacterium]|nr:hypothetical protein [Deltaproteobacteria bacterium]